MQRLFFSVANALRSFFLSCFSFPRFVVWPLELGLGTHNPRFVAWPLKLGLGSYNPRLAAFGTTDAKLEAAQEWFAHRRLQQLAKAEEHLKRWCGMVTPGVKGEVERLLRQARGCLGMNGQCTVANLKRLLTYLDLSCSGPKAELMQQVYNHADSLQSYMGLPADTASVPEESMAEENEDEDEDIVCVHCLSGDAYDVNDILICEGAHSTMVGWHQLCLTPPLREIPTGCWLCPECVSAPGGPGSRLADPDYAPSTVASSSSSSSSSTSASTSDSSSNSNSSSSYDSDSDSDSDTVTVSDFDSVGDSEFD